MNNLKQNDAGGENTMSDTKIGSVQHECKNTMNEWVKRCPRCQAKLVYHNKCNLLRSIRNNSKCVGCLNQSKIGNKDYIKKLSLAKMGDKNPTKRPDVRKKISISGKGKHFHSKEVKEKISRGNSGKVTSETTRQKQREAVLRKIQLYGTHARNYNPSACKFIDEIGQKMNCCFQHALNGGEFVINGYSVDGYDKSKNVIIEYDENRANHFDMNGDLKSKDIERMINIINSLHCKFFRYNAKTKEIAEYNQDGIKIKSEICQ